MGLGWAKAAASPELRGKALGLNFNMREAQVGTYISTGAPQHHTYHKIIDTHHTGQGVAPNTRSAIHTTHTSSRSTWQAVLGAAAPMYQAAILTGATAHADSAHTLPQAWSKLGCAHVLQTQGISTLRFGSLRLVQGFSAKACRS